MQIQYLEVIKQNHEQTITKQHEQLIKSIDQNMYAALQQQHLHLNEQYHYLMHQEAQIYGKSMLCLTKSDDLNGIWNIKINV